MANQRGFDENTSVREIIRRFPATREVFDQYGLMGCGGPEGPTEPLSLFARVHQIPFDALRAQIERAVSGGEEPPVPSVAPSGRPSGIASPVADPRRLSRLFIRSATLAFVTGGCLTGALFLLQISRYGTFEMARLWPGWTAHIQGHGHVQLSGWVTLFIMGIAYFALPRFLVVDLPSTSALKTSYGLMLTGILLRIFYQPFSAERWAANWVFLGAAAEVAAAVIFLRIVLQAVRLSPKKNEPYAQFLQWGAGWLVVSQTILLVHAAAAVVEGRAVILGRPVDEAYLHTMLMGFTGLFIFGVTLRTLPLMLDFRRTASERLQRLVLGAWNLGVLLFAAGQLMRLGGASNGRGLVLAGALVELAAGAAFLIGLNPYQKPQASPKSSGEDVPPAWLWLVRASYVWLAVALVMEAVLASSTIVTGVIPAQPYWGAFRHALTVGWVSMMIFGMAYRMIPVMEGRAPSLAWTAPLVFWLANLGALGRVSLESLAVTHPELIRWMAPTGFVELSAGVFFTLAIWKTIRAPQEIPEKAGEKVEIGPDTVVGKVLDAYPESLKIFVGHGFAALQNPVLRAMAAKMVTISQACRMHGIELEALLRDLTALERSAKEAKTGATPLARTAAGERPLLVQLTSPGARENPALTPRL
jgi:uncharacterized protein DUF1858/NnrS protein